MSEKDNIKRLIEDKGVQFRQFAIDNIEVRQEEDGEGEKLIIKGTPAVFNSETLLYSYRSYDGMDVEVYEKVSPDAFDEADMTDVIFNYNHCGRVFARTRNDSLKLNINKASGLEMETELWDDDEGHKQLHRDIKRGNIDKMSYCYIPGTTSYEMRENEDEGKREYHYTLESIKRVLDVSAVDIPAYDATEISARRLFDAESKEHEAESRNAASVARAKFKFQEELRRK